MATKKVSKPTIRMKVNAYLKTKNVSEKMVQNIIADCQKWMGENKAKKLQDIDAKIAQLKEERNSIAGA